MVGLLSFITSAEGDELFVHADSEGLRVLEREIRQLRKALENGQCHDFHLFTESWAPDGELTDSMLRKEKDAGGNAVQHLKVCAWAPEWKQKHGL